MAALDISPRELRVMYRKTVFAVSVLAAFFLIPPEAWACPFCRPPSGINKVGASIFDETFLTRAAAVVAPFPILIGVVALIYHGPPRGWFRK